MYKRGCVYVLKGYVRVSEPLKNGELGREGKEGQKGRKGFEKAEKGGNGKKVSKGRGWEVKVLN